MSVAAPQTDRQRERLQRVLIGGPWIVVALIALPMMVRTVADPDLWGHTRFGLDMLATHALPRDDPYSFTQDVPWINHEWLSELVMGAAYRVAGSIGLVVLKAALVAAFFAVVVGAYAGASPFVAVPVLFLVAWGTAYLTSTLRPQLWTLLGVALICRLLMTAPRPWWLVALPFLFAVWVNLHGGWIVGAGLLVVWTSVQMCRSHAPRRLIAGVALLSALATLVNPYGWQMWAFLAGTVRMTRDIAEWRPLLTLSVLDWAPWLLVVIGVTVCAIAKPRPPLERLAMVAMLAYSAFRVARTAPLCVVAAVLLMRPSLLATRFNVPLTVDPPSRSALRGLAVALLALTVISGAVTTWLARCIPIAGDWSPDLVAGQTLIDAKVRGKMVTWFDWGEYTLWHLGDGLRVSMDGRRETIYSDTVLEQHFALYEGTLEGLSYLQRLGPDYVWLPASKTRVRDWLATHGYRVDVSTARSFVAVRGDRPRVAPHDGPISACFPGS